MNVDGSDHMLNAFSSLNNLSGAGDDLLAAAAGLLTDALGGTWSVVIRCSIGSSEVMEAVAIHHAASDGAEAEEKISAAAREFAARNPDGPAYRQGRGTIDALGTMHFYAHACWQDDGTVCGYLVTGMPAAAKDESFAEVFMGALAHRLEGAFNPAPPGGWHRQAMELSPAGMALKDTDGRYIIVNRRYRELFDIGDREVRGKTIFELISRPLAEIADYWDKQTLAGNVSGPRTNKFTRADGTNADYEVVKFAISDSDGAPVGICMIVQDVTQRNQARAELAEKTAVLEAILEAVPATISFRDRDGRYVFVNRRGAEAYAVDQADILGRTMADLLGEGTRLGGFDRLPEVLATGKPVSEIEVPSHLMPDKTYSISFAPVFGEHADVMGVVTTARDITEQKRREDELREKELALAEAQRIGRIGHWRIDAKTDLMTMSDQAYRILGYEPGEEERTLEEVRAAVHPDDLRNLAEIRAAAIANREPYEFKYRITLASGEERVMAGVGRPEFDEAGALVSIFGVTRDITEQDRTETELRQSEARMGDFVEASADFYWQTDSDLRYNYISPSFEDHVEFKVEALIGQRPETAIDPIYQEMEPWKYIEQQLQNRRPFRDVVFQRQGQEPGSSVWIRTSGKPYYDENGAFQGFRGSSSNITQQRELEEQLVQAQKMETVGQLTGGVAHDFNNLLAVIMGNAELLLQPEGDRTVTERQSKLLETILRTAGRGAELTQQLLAFSRKQALSPKVIELDKQIAGMISMLHRSLGETIRIEAKSNDGLWPCLVDPGQVENAILNLAVNARDAMPDGGVLTIETANISLVDEFDAAQADMAPGEYVTLSITDTGHGMAPEVRSRVFEPFFTTKAQGKGTGLGLSMVFGFAKQSNGHVTIYSEVERGTTVRLYLPRAEPTPRSEITQVESLPASEGECVLVVEDDPDVRTLTMALLDELGYQALEAPDGAAALGLLKQEPHIDLLFTDVVLPGGILGDELARQAPDYHPSIRVMYMSGYTQDALIRQGNMDDDIVLLHKPFRKADLAQKLRQAIDRPPQADAKPAS